MAGTLENPIVNASSAMLHYPTNTQHPIIISGGDAPIYEKWKSHKNLFKTPAFVTSSHVGFEGSYKLMYMPYNDDHGVMVMESDVTGDFGCAFQVYIDQDLKVAAWGRGYVGLTRYDYGHPPVYYKEQFISPNKIRRKAHNEYNTMVQFMGKLFPDFKIIHWSLRFMRNAYNYHKTQVSAISSAPIDIQCEILEHALPKWPVQLPRVTSHANLLLGIKTMGSWVKKWISHSKPNDPPGHLLPHRWDNIYVVDLIDVIDMDDEK